MNKMTQKILGKIDFVVYGTIKDCPYLVGI